MYDDEDKNVANQISNTNTILRRSNPTSLVILSSMNIGHHHLLRVLESLRATLTPCLLLVAL
jgi:hypothetical protein